MATELPHSSNSFYNYGKLSFNAINGQNGIAFDIAVNANAQPIITEFSPGDDIGTGIATKVREVYDSLEAIQVLVDGEEKTIEAGIIRGTGDRVRLHGGTYSSSLLANFGNGFEEARDAYLDPEVTHVYVGAPGIGLTSPLSRQEAKYVQRHGRLMEIDASDGSIRVLPHIRAIRGVMRHFDVEPTDLHSDSAGALVTAAYGAAYGNGNIQIVHQNVRPGIKDIGPLALAYGMLYLDGAISRRHAGLSPDVLKMDNDKIDLVKASLSGEFKGRNLEAKRSISTLLANLVGLGRGPVQGDPLVVDNIALVQSNPDAEVLFTVGSEDPLAKSDGLQARLTEMVTRISAHTPKPVYAVTFDGMSHNIQTHYPQQLRAVSRFLIG